MITAVENMPSRCSACNENGNVTEFHLHKSVFTFTLCEHCMKVMISECQDSLRSIEMDKYHGYMSKYEGFINPS